MKKTIIMGLILWFAAFNVGLTPALAGLIKMENPLEQEIKQENAKYSRAKRQDEEKKKKDNQSKKKDQSGKKQDQQKKKDKDGEKKEEDKQNITNNAEEPEEEKDKKSGDSKKDGQKNSDTHEKKPGVNPNKPGDKQEKQPEGKEEQPKEEKKGKKPGIDPKKTREHRERSRDDRNKYKRPKPHEGRRYREDKRYGRKHRRKGYHRRERLIGIFFILWLSESEERNEAKNITERTAHVLIRAQTIAWERDDCEGLGEAFTHQMVARDFFRRNKYKKAIYHSLWARAIALHLIDGDYEGWYEEDGYWYQCDYRDCDLVDSELNDREAAYMQNAPSPEEMREAIYDVAISDEDALYLETDRFFF